MESTGFLSETTSQILFLGNQKERLLYFCVNFFNYEP